MIALLSWLFSWIRPPRWPVRVRGFAGPCTLRGDWTAPTGHRYMLIQPLGNARTYAVEPYRVR